MDAHVALWVGFGGSWVLLGAEEESCPGKLTFLGSCQLPYSLLIKTPRIKHRHQQILVSLLKTRLHYRQQGCVLDSACEGVTATSGLEWQVQLRKRSIQHGS